MNINEVKGAGLTSEAIRKKLGEELRTLGIKNNEVIDLVSSMPRHLFIDSALTNRAYENVSLPIGFSQTISQPYIVAKMTELIHEMTSMKNVLEIGTASGYQTSILSMLFDKVLEVASEFAGSGPVDGPGTGVSDSIPARLSDGEFVFTAKSVDVLGADNLMSLMKQAEAQADQRQMAQEGGLMEEEDTAMPVQQEPVRQEIRVTKETVGSEAAMQEEEDLVGDELKKQMLSGRPHVRS